MEVLERTVKKEAQKSSKQTFVILQGGGNGLDSSGSQNTIKNMREIVKDLKEKFENVEIALTPIFPRKHYRPEYEVMRRETNKAMRVLSKEEDLAFIELEEPWNWLVSRDGIHLCRHGHNHLGFVYRRWLMLKGWKEYQDHRNRQASQETSQASQLPVNSEINVLNNLRPSLPEKQPVKNSTSGSQDHLSEDIINLIVEKVYKKF